MNFNIPKSEKEGRGVKIECSERQKVVDKAIFELGKSFANLGINNWNLPTVKINFLPTNDDKKVFGRVGRVTKEVVEIDLDERLSSDESEKRLVEKLGLNGGMKEILKHELGHIALWSVSGQERQSATRLLDEGWATLIENSQEALPIQDSKRIVNEGFEKEPDLYNRCLKFDRPIAEEENLNAAEYQVGQALLLWAYQEFGKEKMIELIKKSPFYTKRNETDSFEPVEINDKIHKHTSEYLKIINEFKENKISKRDAIARMTQWEGKQFSAALMEVTELQNLDEVRAKFLMWVKKE